MTDSSKRAALKKIKKRLAKLFAHLGNANEGEVINGVSLIKRALVSIGLDFNDVAALLAEDPEDQEQLADIFARLLEKDADALVRLGRTGATFFCSTKGIAFAEIRTGERVETLPLTSKAFGEWLVHRYYQERKKAPHLAAEHAAVRTLAAHARYEGGERREVYLRSALVGRTLLLDIGGDGDGRCVEVSPGGWRVLPAAPVKFQRMAGMGALPIPERGGDIKALRSFINLSDKEFILYVAMITDALFPGRPHVLLNLIGASGSGKTTTANIARALTDPAEVLASALPRDARDLFVDVNGALVLSYDNVGSIVKPISDAMCQITSGTGYRKRKLYTDLEQVFVEGSRSIIITSIHNPVTEPDLAERCLTMNLVVPKVRRSATELRAEFERERAVIFGALLDVIACGLKRLPDTQVANLPRLADFAMWGTAIETAFVQPGAFLAAFTASQLTATEAVIEVSPVATAIAALMEDRNTWDGTTAQLWRELKRTDRSEARPTETKDWPKDPTRFSAALSGVIETLRKIGVEVSRERAPDRKRTRTVHLRRLDPPSPQQAAGAASDPADAEDAADAERSEVREGADGAGNARLRLFHKTHNDFNRKRIR
jgi:hypothetical protein